MMRTTIYGIRVYTPFAGRLQELEEAALTYFEGPVHVKLPITLMDASDLAAKHINDEITVAIVDVDHKGDDKNIVLLRTKVIEGAKQFNKVPVSGDGSADMDIEVLCNGDDVTLIVDAACGDAAIVQNSDNVDKVVVFDGLSKILPRLSIPSGLPTSTGDPVSWEDFLAGPAGTD